MGCIGVTFLQVGVDGGFDMIRVRESSGRLMRVRTELLGMMASVEEFQSRVAERAERTDLSPAEVTDLVHDARATED